MKNLRSFLRFAFSNFGPVIIFYVINRFYGLKPAIVISTTFSIFEIASKLKRKEKINSLFKFSAAMTVAFGAVDLYSQQSFLFKYEPCVTNIFTGIFFGASLFAKKTVLQEFREKQDFSRPFTRDRVAYFRILTGVWTAYFIVKAAAYFWMASHYSIEEGLLFRSVLGTGSFYGLLFVSIVGSKYVFPILKRSGLLPPAETGPYPA